MTDWTGGTCPRHNGCTFYSSVTASPILRVKYATMYPYCRQGRHESCMRWWAMEHGQELPDDLLPDGGKDVFAAEARGKAAVVSGRVLVVDDMPMFRKSLAGLVRMAGCAKCEVVEAESAETALQLLLQTQTGWTLVVTDYNMGAMNGYDLLERMRAHPNLAAVPVVVFSSEADPSIREKCSALPRVRWLAKRPDREPFDQAWRDLVVDRKL